MIGFVRTGKSFRGVLNYCLHDKREFSHEEKLQMEKIDRLKHLNRAEILDYNLCCGNKKELLEQFREVRNTNPGLQKPVLHVTLSLDPGDRADDEKLRDIARDYAEKFGFDKNQYVTILHHDTQHKHLHIVANRVGFDEKTVSDSHSFRKSAEICRQLEQKYELKHVLSPRLYLSQEERLLPRHDMRKEWMKETIRDCLLEARDFDEFKRKMEQQKIEVIKGRGIAFQDDKKVYMKGSDLGYSMATIEKVLQHSLQQRQELAHRLELTRQKELEQSKWTERQIEQYKMYHIMRNTMQHLSKEVKEYLEHQPVQITRDPSAKRLLDELTKPQLQKQICQELLSDDDYKYHQRQRQQQLSMGR